METSNSLKKLPYFFIGKSATDKRKANYISKKYPKLCKELGRNDTKSIWYSREHIASLLEEIDLASGDGMIIHFGVYEETHPYAGQLCLLMNITRSENGSRMEILLEEEPNFKQRQSTEPVKKTLGEVPRDFNFGSPCPPRCHDGGGIRNVGDGSNRGG